MRVSQHFGLLQDQPSLDFVDVDVTDDVPVFIDPKAIRMQRGDWTETCQDLLVSFFAEVLEAIRNQDRDRVRSLVGALGEPNETHLGVGKGASRGRGLGAIQSEKLVAALTDSEAAKTGLLSDLEDSTLLVPGIDRDIVSDITTHVIRSQLVAYTQDMCRFYGIPMVKQTVGQVWDSDSLKWEEPEALLPRVGDGPLLLVPKSIVRVRMTTDKGKYYRGYLQPLLEQAEISAGTELVRTLVSGRKTVNKKQLRAKHGDTKPDVIRHTKKYPEALGDYKASLKPEDYPPPDHEQLRAQVQGNAVDFFELFDAVKAIATGGAGATPYHRAVTALLTALFDTALGNEKVEQKIHDGRKRLDIRYDNVAASGFFAWLGKHYHAATVVVECKNYTGDLGNNELDQLGGRFSPNRGQVGLLLCRSFKDKQLFLKRCRDTAQDARGFIIVVDDDDLKMLVDEAHANRNGTLAERTTYALLDERFKLLID